MRRSGRLPPGTWSLPSTVGSPLQPAGPGSEPSWRWKAVRTAASTTSSPSVRSDCSASPSWSWPGTTGTRWGGAPGQRPYPAAAPDGRCGRIGFDPPFPVAHRSIGSVVAVDDVGHQPSTAAELVGALGLIELQAGPRCRSVVRAMRRLDANEDALAFYEEHAVADPKHGKAWLNHAVRPLSTDPWWAAGMVRGRCLPIGGERRLLRSGDRSGQPGLCQHPPGNCGNAEPPSRPEAMK